MNETAEFYLDFVAFFRSQYRRIVTDIYFVVGNKDIAMEIANEAFIRALMKWKKVSQYDKPGAWVRRVGIRLALKARNRSWRESGAMEDRAASAIDSDLRLDLQRAILTLPKQQRAAIVLHYYEDMQLAEVAKVLGCREATAKRYLFLGREKLRELLSPTW